ncbi:hypothetical protein FRC07_006418 [Ceratobasidium sp. 392]|nr:hypothetical protein FRC07_006418 [Ceratobasidium sp. 392]
MVSPWMENGGVNRLNSSNRVLDRYQLGNVLLSENNNAQLADFGNAVLVNSTLAFTGTTAQSGFSTRWAAPEQLDSTITYSRQADVYSLGMGFFYGSALKEIGSRQLPYADIKHEAAVIRAILSRKNPKRPEDTIPTNNRKGNLLWSLLKACWIWDSEDRPKAPVVAMVIASITSEDQLSEHETAVQVESSNTNTLTERNQEAPLKRSPSSEVQGQAQNMLQLHVESIKSFSDVDDDSQAYSIRHEHSLGIMILLTTVKTLARLGRWVPSLEEIDGGVGAGEARTGQAVTDGGKMIAREGVEH